MASSSRASPALPLHNLQPSNRNTTSQTPATPNQSPETSAQSEPTYSSMFDRVANARREAGAAFDKFYTDGDVYNHSPKGWPLIAAAHMYFPNCNSHRGFISLTHSILTCYEQKIHCIEDELNEMDFEDDEAEGKPLRSLPFDREQFIARCIQGTAHLPQPLPLKPDEVDATKKRENLSISVGIMLREYFSILHMQHENLKFAHVSRRAHEEHFKSAQYFHGLNNMACAFMRYIDDFVSIEPDQVFQRFEALVLSNSHWVPKFLQTLLRLTPTHPQAPPGTNPATLYNLRRLSLYLRIVLVICSLVLLLTPVSVLYLAEAWPRAAYLGVVAVWSVVFAAVMAVFEARTAHLLVGLTAFFAVLVTFLSNLPGCGGA
ncbi:hypothetical protein GGR54DRAFT_41141 [Hypoxylon sp. NC1633]|nr:hypothetical protein GGR54DRAFT_41141 [Hypoxylon sp. NC1633]